MGHRSQRHKQEVHGYRAPAVLPPTIISVTPPTAVHGTTQNFGIVGTNFMAGDVINFRGVDYPATFIDSTHLSIVNVTMGAVASVLYYAKHPNGMVSPNYLYEVT